MNDREPTPTGLSKAGQLDELFLESNQEDKRLDDHSEKAPRLRQASLRAISSCEDYVRAGGDLHLLLTTAGFVLTGGSLPKAPPVAPSCAIPASPPVDALVVPTHDEVLHAFDTGSLTVKEFLAVTEFALSASQANSLLYKLVSMAKLQIVPMSQPPRFEHFRGSILNGTIIRETATSDKEVCMMLRTSYTGPSIESFVKNQTDATITGPFQGSYMINLMAQMLGAKVDFRVSDYPNPSGNYVANGFVVILERTVRHVSASRNKRTAREELCRNLCIQVYKAFHPEDEEICY